VIAGWFRVVPEDREIFRLAVPALAALAAEPLYVLVDTAIVGHLGTEPLAGLALATTVILTGFSLSIFLAYGTTSSVARLLGAGRDREAAEHAVQGLWMAAAISVVLSGLVLLNADWLIRMLGGEGAVAEQALIYLRISMAGVPALLLTLAGTGYLRGLQDTRTPMLIAIGTALGNLVLELTLINGLGFGIGASALSTVIAQWVGALIYLARIARSAGKLGVGFRPVPSAIRAQLVVAGSLFLRTVSMRGALIVAVAVATRIGTEELAAFQVGFEMWSLLALALDAVAIAGQALIGRYLGAEDPEAARRAGDRMNRWAIGCGVVFAIIVLALRDVLPGVFTDDPAVARLITISLIWVAVLQPVGGLAFSLDGILIGAGDLRWLARAMGVAGLLFATASIVVHQQELGLTWLWAALGLWMVARTAFTWQRYRSDTWLVTGH